MTAPANVLCPSSAGRNVMRGGVTKRARLGEQQRVLFRADRRRRGNGKTTPCIVRAFSLSQFLYSPRQFSRYQQGRGTSCLDATLASDFCPFLHYYHPKMARRPGRAIRPCVKKAA